MKYKLFLALFCLSLLTFLPLFFISPWSWSFLVFILILSSFVAIMGILYHKTFALFVASSSLLTAFLVHLRWHWGVGDLRARFETILESPLYEAKEYLSNHVGWMEGGILLYAVILGWLYLKAHHYRREELITINTKRWATFALVVVASLIVSDRQAPFSLVDDFLAAQQRMNEVTQRTIGEVKRTDINGTQLYDNVIIVVGESALRTHMSLYGYERKTTPFLDSWDGVKFKTIAPINQTRYAIPIELSAATVNDYKVFFRSPSLVSYFKSLGYETSWISNQGSKGLHDSTVASIGKEADHSVFFNVSFVKARDDQKVVEYLKEQIAKKPQAKQAYFLHLMGSHDDYDKRYPKAWARFGEKSVFDRYDNTIYFTDHILEQINQLAQGLGKVLIVYFSDHGELVAWENNGHGFDPAYQQEYQTPLVFHSSIPNPHLDRLFSQYKDQEINAETLDEMIKIVMGTQQDLNKVSTRRDVLVLNPDHKISYDRLRKFYK